MAKPHTRRAASPRLASPEQLDQPVRLLSSQALLAFVMVVAAMSAAVIASFIVRVPVKVASQGILIEAGGLLELTALHPGRIRRLMLEPGQRIRRGEVVAELAQADLRKQLENSAAELVSARERLERLVSFYEASRARERDVDEKRLQTIAEMLRRLRVRISLLQKKESSIARLVERKTLVEDELIDTQLQVSDARERVAALEDEAAQIPLRQFEREQQRRAQLLEQRLTVSALERERDRLARLLEGREKFVSPYEGTVIEVQVNSGDVVASGQPLATVQPPATDANAERYGLVYVSPIHGKSIKAGMPVEISPTTVRREEFGYMLGEVVEISPLPATVGGMQRRLQNEQLVEQLSGSGAPFEARIRLHRDASTPSGFAWSSSGGPQVEINAGTLFEGRIIVRRIRLATLILPYLRRLLPEHES